MTVMATNTAVYGLYKDRLSVEEAVESLKSAGFRGTDISALLPDNTGSKDFAHQKNTKAPEGAIAGAVIGAVIGAALGWAAGTGVLVLPGIGPLIAAGPIMAALAGFGAAGALGAILGALIGFGFPEYEAKRFEGRLRQGGVLLSVHCDNSDWVKRAKHLLVNTGATSVASSSEGRADFMVTDKPLPRPTKQGV
jgi:Protein of unknown function (DUF3341)